VKGSYRRNPLFLIRAFTFLCLATVAVAEERKIPSLPKPGQVDRPEMIRFIKPDPKALPGIIVDDMDAKLIGQWKHSVHTPPFVGQSYVHDMKEAKGKKSATFTPDLPKGGYYEVRMSHNSNVRRANDVPVTIRHADGVTTVKVNEGEYAPIEKLFRSLGVFRFEKGRDGSVTIGTTGTDGKYVIVDSVQFLLVKSKHTSFSSKKQERRFSAGQVFDYNQPIIFESDFDGQGLDKWNLSEDDRYRLAKTNPNRLRITDAPGRVGEAKAVRFFVPREPNSFRAEISLPSEKGFNERWYGILTYVPEDWKVDPNKGADILIQWHAIPGNWRSTHPNLTICIQNSNWQVRRNFGLPQKNPERKIHNLEKPFQPGAWVSWVIHAKWSPGKDGLIRIWKDGEQVLDQKGPNVYGTIGKEYTPYLKTGIYHPEWHLNSDGRKKRYGAEISGVTKKEAYVAKVVVGSKDATYEMMASFLDFQKEGSDELPPVGIGPKAVPEE
tara:strand:- start:720 stop:2204 length:1485 start_codon:yes stop_codon:yes gene_type:complete